MSNKKNWEVQSKTFVNETVHGERVQDLKKQIKNLKKYMVSNGDNAYIEKQNVLENHMDKILLF